MRVTFARAGDDSDEIWIRLGNVLGPPKNVQRRLDTQTTCNTTTSDLLKQGGHLNFIVSLLQQWFNVS